MDIRQIETAFASETGLFKCFYCSQDGIESLLAEYDPFHTPFTNAPRVFVEKDKKLPQCEACYKTAWCFDEQVSQAETSGTATASQGVFEKLAQAFFGLISKKEDAKLIEAHKALSLYRWYTPPNGNESVAETMTRIRGIISTIMRDEWAYIYYTWPPNADPMTWRMLKDNWSGFPAHESFAEDCASPVDYVNKSLKYISQQLKALSRTDSQSSQFHRETRRTISQSMRRIQGRYESPIATTKGSWFDRILMRDSLLSILICLYELSRLQHALEQSGTSDIPATEASIATHAPISVQQREVANHDIISKKKFWGAVISGSSDRVKYWIDEGMDVNGYIDISDEGGMNSRMYSFRTPLIAAARNNHNDIAELLIGAGADINAQARSGETALWASVSFDSQEVFNLLLKNGADYSIANYPTDFEGDNSISFSCYRPIFAAMFNSESYKEKFVKALLSAGDNPNRAHEDEKETPLEVASRFGETDIAQALVDAGATVTDKCILDAEELGDKGEGVLAILRKNADS